MTFGEKHRCAVYTLSEIYFSWLRVCVYLLRDRNIDWLIYVRVSTITAIWTVSHRLRSTLMNGHRFTVLSLPWWSPIQILTQARRYLTSVTEPLSKQRNWCLDICPWARYSQTSTRGAGAELTNELITLPLIQVIYWRPELHKKIW